MAQCDRQVQFTRRQILVETQVGRVLKRMNQKLLTVKPDDTVLDAVNLISNRDIGALLVMENGNLAGIVTERDFIRKVLAQGKQPQDVKIGEIMVRNVIYVESDETIEECMAVMAAEHVRHLPVVDGDTLLGIISIRDVVNHLVSEKQFMIEQLEHYITDRRPHL